MRIVSDSFDKLVNDDKTVKAGWNLPLVGDRLICTVSGIEPGGYTVKIGEREIPGFLPFEGTLEIGQKITAQFVIAYQKKWLVSFLPQ
jgi:hypothetical protein